MKRVGNEIYEGKVSTNPIPDGCNYCPYESICGISCKLPGFETKKVKVRDKRRDIQRNGKGNCVMGEVKWTRIKSELSRLEMQIF